MRSHPKTVACFNALLVICLARRHMALLNGHVPTGGLQRNGNPLLDFNTFPLRIMETPDNPQEAILKLEFSGGIYNKSKGGVTFSGWKCGHLPYLVELDNYGISQHPGQPNAKGEFNWVWGCDEIIWFAHQPKDYRAKWLQYAWDWVRKMDTNGISQNARWSRGKITGYAMVFRQ